MAGVVGSHPISASEATRSGDKASSLSALRSSAKPTGLVDSRRDLPRSSSAANRGEVPSTKQTPSLSSRTSSASSSSDTPETPSSRTESSSVHVERKSLKARSPSKAAPVASAAKSKMLDDAFHLPPVNVITASSSSSKANYILGPDGGLYTQGEAAKLGLIIRTACEACRNRKLKCSGTLPENGGCERCSSDDIQCVYSARAPIGRPKKRKTEDGQETSLSSPPVVSGKGKAKRKLSTSLSRVKKEDEQSSYASSLIRQASHQHNVLQHGSPADATALLSLDPYASPMQSSTAHHSIPVNSTSASTPTVWSQHQAAFASTPSDVMTPHSVLSSSFAPAQPNGLEAQTTTSASADKLPSLDDLSVAAFLQSLDTLEISPAELLQQQQQMQLLASSSSTSAYGSTYGLGAPFEASHNGIAEPADHLTASSVQEWATSSAILQPGLSFAVPADFSWWDLGINGVDSGAGSASASVPATPATEPSSMSFSTGSALPSHVTGATGPAGHQGRPSASTGSAPKKSRRPTFSTDQLWPRGADAGMGQGQIQHAVAATETGLGWSTLPGQSLSDAPSSPVENHAVSSCCSSKSAKTGALSPAEVKDDHKASRERSCCSSKAATESTSTAKAEPASCCAGKTANSETQAVKPQPSSTEAIKSCCSGHATEPPAASPSASTSPIEMGPLSTSAAVNGNKLSSLDAERKHHAALHAHHPSKVHCVPNPSGRGCTCLCDMSVALLSVKQVLRETDPYAATANDTIQLTLTASQAITAQCACSTDCPTCQSDPSTEISASLLVSTALQIYARAVRILREGFAASAIGGPAETSTVHSFFGGLDVTIGTYKPSASNAKKIALYAIKLELKDLRRALGRVSRMAQRMGPSKGGTEAEGMNPIDQLVILKLYRQLTELLRTVEGLEDAA